MSEISKGALTSENNSSFPNNNTGYITPTILRTFNQNMIDSLVDEISYTADSASANTKITQLQQFSSSLDATFATDAQLAALSSSVAVTDLAQSQSIAALQSFSSSLDNSFVSETQFNVYTSSQTAESASFNARINALDPTGSAQAILSLNAATASLYAYTASNDSKWNTLGGQTGSYVTEAESGSFVTSVLAGGTPNVISVTKGNGTINTITVDNVTSASFAVTASEARNVVLIARNQNASTLAAGTLVHIVDAVGDNPIFNTASFDTETLSANTLGMLRTPAASGADVEVLVNGIVTGVNTDPALGYVAGDILYLSSSGEFTRVQPQAPKQIVTIGQVLRAQQNNGSIYVNITNGWELEELHNVAINGVVNGDLLVYRSGSGLWTNSSSLELGLATTGSNTFIGDQTISGFGVSVLDLHGVNDGMWWLRLFNDTYNSTQSVFAGWVDNSGTAYIGNEVDTPINIYTNAQYGTPNLQISSSGLTIRPNLTITGSLHQSGTFYPDVIDWFSSSIQLGTGSYILTTDNNGVTQYHNYQNIALALNPYITGSLDTRYAASGSFETTGRGILSGSVSYTSLTNIPSGIVSGSSQITSLLPNGVISGSSQLPSGLVSGSSQVLGESGIISSSTQITHLGFISSSTDVTPFLSASIFNTFTSSYVVASGSFDSRINAIVSAGVPTGTISGSTQIVNLGFATTSSVLNIDTSSLVTTSSFQPFSASINTATSSLNSFTSSINTTIKTKLNDDNVLSGSISYGSLTGVPSGIVSSSTQIIAGLPSGTVSGSSQVLSGTNIVSSSTQITTLGFATTGSQTLSGNQTVNGNLVVTGSITAQTFIVSSSVYYVTASSVSGSSNFGNSLDDNHNFTGSVYITGSLSISGSLNLSPSASLGARLWQLSDVRDSITGSADGYLLSYSSASGDWVAAAGATAKGTVRLYIATQRANSSAFYFNANTRTASDSASPSADSAFMVTTNLLSRVTVYLRQDNAGPNSTIVGIGKNADGAAFSSATLITSSSLSLGQNTIQTWQFSGLTLNTFDSLHIYCDPTNTPGTMYGIVIID